MSCVHNLGMSRDKTERNTLARIDDCVRQSKIQSTRAHIYDSTLGVMSTAVESLLKDQSLVPTSVSYYCFFFLSLPLNGGPSLEEHIFQQAFMSWFQSILHVGC